MRQMLWIKLASIAVHAEKLLTADGPGAGADDVAAIKGLLADKDVQDFLNAPKNAAMLPPRSA